MRRKGQASEMFTYAITFIVVGLVLLFGYMGISALVKSFGGAVEDKFKDSVKKDLERYTLNWDQRTVTYSVPSRYEKVCFVDLRKKGSLSTASPSNTDGAWGGSSNFYQEIKDSVSAGDEHNVFAVVAGGAEPIVQANANILFEVRTQGVKCIEVQNSKLSLRYVGQGKEVIVQTYCPTECCDPGQSTECEMLYGYNSGYTCNDQGECIKNP